MSLFRSSAVPERRAITGDEWIRGLDGSARTKSGVVVTPNAALKLGAVWSTTNLLAGIVSDLPVDVFRGSNKVPVSPQPQVIARPSLIVTRRQWMYQAMMSLLLRGNAYGLVVERDAVLRPRTIEWLHPDSVKVTQANSLSRPTYEVGGSLVPSEDMIHLRAFVQPGSAVGLSPVEYHAESIGVGLGAQKFGAQWFGDGGHPTALFQNKAKTLSPEQSKDIKSRIIETLRGKREPLVVGSDWTYTPIQVAANESQFIEAQGYTDAQIAKLYGPGLAEILGYAQGGSSLTYSNRVDRSLDVLTYCVLHWVGLFEDFLTEIIAQPQTAKLNVKALLRADPKTQHEMFRVDREIGLRNVDEIRDLLDEEPLPDGAGQDYSPLKATKPGSPADDVARSIRSAAPVSIAPPNVDVSVSIDGVRAESPSVTVNVEPTPVTVAPTVRAAAPVVNVAAADVTVNVDPTPVNVTVEPAPVMVETPVNVTVEPAPVHVLPMEPKTKTVQRDRNGRIVAVHEE